MVVDKRWVGAVLRLTREYRGISRDRMAHECGVSPGTISHWETGRVLLNAAQLATWARVCGLDLDLLAREAGLQDTPEHPAPTTTLRGYWRSRGHIPSVDSTESARVDSDAPAPPITLLPPDRGAIAPGNPPARHPHRARRALAAATAA